MKTFEVYSLNDPSYRGRVLVAALQADRFEIKGNTIGFFKDTFFSTKLMSSVVVIGAFAVLDTEFSLGIERDVPVKSNPDVATPEEEAQWINPIRYSLEPKPRRRASRKTKSVLGLE